MALVKAPLGIWNRDDVMAGMHVRRRDHIANQEVRKILGATRALLIPLKDITPSRLA